MNVIENDLRNLQVKIDKARQHCLNGCHVMCRDFLISAYGDIERIMNNES